jgi:hypothetical protein
MERASEDPSFPPLSVTVDRLARHGKETGRRRVSAMLRADLVLRIHLTSGHGFATVKPMAEPAVQRIE